MPNLKISASFSVSEDIARRAGLYGLRYMTADGRVLLSEADLRRVRLMPSEYVNGMDVIEISETESNNLAADNGFRMLPDQDTQESPEEETAGDAVVVEPEEQASEDTPEEGESSEDIEIEDNEVEEE